MNIGFLPFMLVIVGIFAVIVLAAAAWHALFSARARRRQLLRKAKGVRISQARDGQLVKVVGRLHYADGEEPLRAPLSDRFGAFYVVEVEEHKRGKNERWKEIIRERATHQTIWIVGAAEGERALVDLGVADVELVMDARYESGFFNDASPRLESFLAAHGYGSEGWLFNKYLNKALRYREGVLEQGERIAVLGRCVREPDPNPQAGGGERSYREAPTRLRLVPPAQHELLVTDDPQLLK